MASIPRGQSKTKPRTYKEVLLCNILNKHEKISSQNGYRGQKYECFRVIRVMSKIWQIYTNISKSADINNLFAKLIVWQRMYKFKVEL